MNLPWIDVVLAWIGTWAIHVTIAVLAVLLVDLTRRRRAPASPTAWRFALLGALVSATAQLWWAPSLVDITALWAEPVAAGSPTPLAGAAPSVAGMAPPTTGDALAGSREPWTRNLPLALFAACASLALLGLSNLWRSRRLLHALLRSRRPVEDARVLTLIGAVADRLGLQQTPRLSRCNAIATPVAFGFVRPEICVPERVAELDDEALHALLAHELSHLQHGDALWLWLGAIVQAVFPWHPAVRLLRRRLYDASELRCDAIAADCAGPVAVANCLIEVAGWLRPPAQAPRGALAMAARPSALRMRVEAALRGPTWRPASRHARVAALIVAGVAQTALLPGVRAPAPMAVPVDAADAPTVDGADDPFAAFAHEYDSVQAEAAQLRAELGSSDDPRLLELLRQLQDRAERLGRVHARLQSLLRGGPTVPEVPFPQPRSSR